MRNRARLPLDVEEKHRSGVYFVIRGSVGTGPRRSGFVKGRSTGKMKYRAFEGSLFTGEGNHIHNLKRKKRDR